MALVTDSTRGIIPNRLTVPALVLGLAAGGVLGGPAGLKEAFLGALLGGALMAIPFLVGGMGAGDVKLLVALGAWLGPQSTLQTFVYAALLGGVVGLVLIVGRRGWVALYPALSGSWRWLKGTGSSSEAFPYAACLWFVVFVSAVVVRS